MEKFKVEKEKIEKDFKKKCEDQVKKEKEFFEVKEGYDVEFRKIFSEFKKFVFGNLQKLKKAEKVLSEGIILEDEVLLIIEFLSFRGILFLEVFSRIFSRLLAQRIEEDLEIEKYLVFVIFFLYFGFIFFRKFIFGFIFVVKFIFGFTLLGKSIFGFILVGKFIFGFTLLGKFIFGSIFLGKIFIFDGKFLFRYISVQENVEED